jgi:hypothetical protein
MRYPGRIIKAGEQDAAVVRAVKERLNESLAIDHDPALRCDPDDPVFDARTKAVVKLFQARNVDSAGRPLKQDGEIGSLTWGTLFGIEAVFRNSDPGDTLRKAAIEIAGREADNGVREEPRNSNRGPRVEEYQRRVGIAPGLAWCCAFMYWCFDEAAATCGCRNPMVRTGGCLEHWRQAPRAGAKCVDARQAIDDPSLITPGMIFVIDHGGGLGHTGLVESVAGGLLSTIEGNTDASKTREGGGVYRLTRKVAEINKGFVLYSGKDV